MRSGWCDVRWRGAAAALFVAHATVAEANDSVFTSIRTTDCRRPADEVVAPFTSLDLGVQQCPAPRGWRLLLIASDRSTWIEVSSARARWSGEDAVVYDQPIGNFPSVGGSQRIEWRRSAKGEVIALIFRVSAQDVTNARRLVSRLFVLRFDDDRACLLGRVRTNREARGLADGAQRCASSTSASVSSARFEKRRPVAVSARASTRRSTGTPAYWPRQRARERLALLANRQPRS